MANAVFDRIRAARVVPVISHLPPEAAMQLGDALSAGGLPCAELTLRAPDSIESLRIMASRGDMLVGAGTVRTVDDASRAVDAGAQFLVSPGMNPPVVQWPARKNVPMIPGVATATEIERAIDEGLEVLKFFPSEALGGVPTLRTYSAIYRSLWFMPTGGVTLEKLPQYLAFDRLLAAGGSWMLGADHIRRGEFDSITELVRTTMEIVRRS